MPNDTPIKLTDEKLARLKRDMKRLYGGTRIYKDWQSAAWAQYNKMKRN